MTVLGSFKAESTGIELLKKQGINMANCCQSIFDLSKRLGKFDM